jgi:hypothetical protein
MGEWVVGGMEGECVWVTHQGVAISRVGQSILLPEHARYSGLSPNLPPARRAAAEKAAVIRLEGQWDSDCAIAVVTSADHRKVCTAIARRPCGGCGGACA